MWSNFLVYVSEIFGHWLALVFGPVITLVLVFAEKWLKWDVRRKHYVIVFLIGIPFAMFFAWRDEHTSSEWRGKQITRLTAEVQDRDMQIRALNNELETKQRPIVVQAAPDQAVEALLARQDRELRALKNEIPSPRKRALRLSNDILAFLAARMKVEPNESPPVGMTKQQFLQAIKVSEQRYDLWARDTASQYQVQFGRRVETVIDDMQSAGIKTNRIQMCLYSNGNTFQIQDCGARIGALAEKLPK